VLGATVGNVLWLLSTDFLRLVMIATCIAFPLTWWLMEHWLEGFAYRVNIDLTIFLYAGTGLLLITILTISFQALRAALADPVKSLKME